MEALHPIERARGIAQFADAVVERALALADAAKIEAQHDEAAPHERLVERLLNLLLTYGLMVDFYSAGWRFP